VPIRVAAGRAQPFAPRAVSTAWPTLDGGMTVVLPPFALIEPLTTVDLRRRCLSVRVGGQASDDYRSPVIMITSSCRGSRMPCQSGLGGHRIGR
jgi:hypothetical protein